MRWVWRLDYVGIYISIMGMCNLGAYIELGPCAPPWLCACVIAAGSTGCCCSIAFLLAKGDAYGDEGNRLLRTAPFAGSLLVYSVPYAWKLAAHGLQVYSAHLLAALACPAVGAAFFITAWPERRWPDWRFGHTWCSSHALWHWSNVAGEVCFQRAVLAAAGARRL